METTSTEANGRTRTLGRSGIEVGALGFGCWAVGGEWQTPDGQPRGWGTVDDDESVRAIRRALDLGGGGRTLAQGALAWLWARSPRTVPIPGFRTVAQAEENAGARTKDLSPPGSWRRPTACSDGEPGPRHVGVKASW